SVANRNSVVIALPQPNGVSPKAIVSFLNSKLVRFYYLTRLRPGVLEGSSRSHIYPRVLEALPWVRTLDLMSEQQLVEGYNELARLAAIAKNNPDEWLLAEVETRIETSRYKLSDRNLGINFSTWTPDDVLVTVLTLDGNFIRAELFSLDLGNADIAELVYKLLILNSDEEATIPKSIIQKLVIPQDYANLMQTYRQKLADFHQVEADFFAVLQQIDDTVYTMFGLADQKAYIESRLASFPLNKLQPRYPWQTVKPRPIKAYTSDRFA
ncbi:MAG: N-6 DNA methylase, partial [Cyanothece sp. SIO2G6]|nr:N-6 DNA methylase [Cyanothece sp. SIO2G6]